MERMIRGQYFLDVAEYYTNSPEIYLELTAFLAEKEIFDANAEYSIVYFHELIDWLFENLGEANTKTAGKRLIRKVKSLFSSSHTSPEKLLYDFAMYLEEQVQIPIVDMIEITAENDLLKIRMDSNKVNRFFISGIIEEILTLIKNIFFIRETDDVLASHVMSEGYVLAYRAIEGS